MLSLSLIVSVTLSVLGSETGLLMSPMGYRPRVIGHRCYNHGGMTSVRPVEIPPPQSDRGPAGGVP